MIWRWGLSVRPSVCGSVHKACKHDTDRTVSAGTVKLGKHITYNKRKNPIDFQGQGHILHIVVKCCKYDID